MNKTALVEGIIQQAYVMQARRPMLICKISDGTGQLILRFFHFNNSQYQQLKKENVNIRCFGEIKKGRFGWEVIHPDYQLISEEDELPLEACLTPLYPTTEGLSQARLRNLIKQALQKLIPQKKELEIFPPSLLESLNFTSIEEALHYVHQPPPDAPVEDLLSWKHPMQQRLILEELATYLLAIHSRRTQIKCKKAPSLISRDILSAQFVKQLPFTLTQAQKRVWQEVSEDIKKNSPMLRLVQGDVGSGKTVISALAALQAAEVGYQVALMAPTELLAEQHYQNFCRWFSPLNISVDYLISRLSAAQRQLCLGRIRSGETQVIIGTHALFQEEVAFKKLGLCIIDEQHRFGVHQRLTLRNKGVLGGEYPHQMIMTATPIPRTLAMTTYADVDVSSIDELPAGRKPIETVLISNDRRQEVLERVRENCCQGKQAYWVCTLIEESEILECQAAEETASELTDMLSELTVGLVHGRLKSKDKEKVMKEFKEGKIDVMVATTVIEVGVDVPKATLMIIENPERLGLAQLHQLRGRVGRGEDKSHCVLLYQKPLSLLSKERLSILKATTDGFKIAEKDLELRGAGEILGTQQSGMMKFKIAELGRDQLELKTAQSLAKILATNYPQLIHRLERRWLIRKTQFKEV